MDLWDLSVERLSRRVAADRLEDKRFDVAATADGAQRQAHWGHVRAMEQLQTQPALAALRAPAREVVELPELIQLAEDVAWGRDWVRKNPEDPWRHTHLRQMEKKLDAAMSDRVRIK